jgi:hypothetical protein
MTQTDVLDGPTLSQKPKAPEGETRMTRTRPALQKALLALLEEKTFEEVTVRELTARAGVPSSAATPTKTPCCTILPRRKSARC